MKQQPCPTCGRHADVHGTVSVPEILEYLETDRYMPLTEAAKYLGLSRRTLQSRLKEIRHYRPGGKILVKRSDLDRWMERYRQEPISKDEIDAIVDSVMRSLADQ